MPLPGKKLNKSELKGYFRKYKNLQKRIVEVSKHGGLIKCHRVLACRKEDITGPNRATIISHIKASTLAYIATKKRTPSKSSEVYTRCGDVTCCKPEHLVSERPGRGDTRRLCPGRIKVRTLPNKFLDMCTHNPKCLRITYVDDMKDSDGTEMDEESMDIPEEVQFTPLAPVEDEDFDDFQDQYIDYVAEMIKKPESEKKTAGEDEKKTEEKKTEKKKTKKKTEEKTEKKPTKKRNLEEIRLRIHIGPYKNRYVDNTVQPKDHQTRLAKKRKLLLEQEESEELEEPEESEEESEEPEQVPVLEESSEAEISDSEEQCEEAEEPPKLMSIRRKNKPSRK